MKIMMFFLSVTVLMMSHVARAVEPVAKEQAVTNGQSVAKEPPVTAEQALAAVALLETNAASDAGVEASKKIIRFAQESHAVTVRLNPATVPWAHAKVLEREGAVRLLLLGAYIGGDVRAQLMAQQKPSDDPYDGWRSTIDVYRQIRQKKPNIVIPEIDALVEKQKTGELKRYAAEIQNEKPTP